MAPYKMFYECIYKKYIEHEAVVWILIIGLPLLIIGLGCMFLPNIFWDNFIWKYYWGPVEADAQNHPIGDITEGYNIVSTLSYGVILSVAVFGIYRLFKVLKIDLNLKFFAAMIPYVILGGVWRALEDAELFKIPLKYLFIAPNIYVFEGLVTIAIVVICAFIERYVNCIRQIRKRQIRKKNSKSKSSASKQRKEVHIIYLIFAFILGFMVGGYVFISTYFASSFAYLPDLYASIIIITVPVLIYLSYVSFKINRNYNFAEEIDKFDFVLIIGLVLLSHPFYLCVIWFVSMKWSVPPFPTVPEELLIIPLIAFSITCLLYLFSRVSSKQIPYFSFFSSGINLLILFGQFLDASATYRALDFHSYGEKHVLPNFLIQVAGTAAVMFPLKLIVVGLVLYLIDVEMKEDFKEYKTLIGLVKFAVLVLGFAPGVRDMMRLAMGV
ncbi:MAG: DUF63 family protein [Thermoplasmata archaeon]